MLAWAFAQTVREKVVTIRNEAKEQPAALHGWIGKTRAARPDPDLGGRPDSESEILIY